MPRNRYSRGIKISKGLHTYAHCQAHRTAYLAFATKVWHGGKRLSRGEGGSEALLYVRKKKSQRQKKKTSAAIAFEVLPVGAFRSFCVERHPRNREKQNSTTRALRTRALHPSQNCSYIAKAPPALWVGRKIGLTRDLPTPSPLALKKVKIMPPPRRITSHFSMSASMTVICTPPPPPGRKVEAVEAVRACVRQESTARKSEDVCEIDLAPAFCTINSASAHASRWCRLVGVRHQEKGASFYRPLLQ